MSKPTKIYTLVGEGGMKPSFWFIRAENKVLAKEMLSLHFSKNNIQQNIVSCNVHGKKSTFTEIIQIY